MQTEAREEQDSEEDISASKTKASWRILFGTSEAQHRPWLIQAAALAVASGALTPAMSILLGKIFDQFTDYGARQISTADFKSSIAASSWYLAILGAACMVFSGGRFAAWVLHGELKAQSLRSLVFESLFDKPIAWYDKRSAGTGSTISRAQTHIGELQLATAQPMGTVLHCAVASILSMVVALAYCWKLTLVIVATVPVSALVLGAISRKMQPYIQSQQRHLSTAGKLLQNALVNIDTVKCFNGEEVEARKYTASTSRAARDFVRHGFANAAQIGFVRFALMICFVQGFWYGQLLVANGEATFGTVVTTFWSCLSATRSLEAILPQLMIFEKGRIAAASLQQLITSPGCSNQRQGLRLPLSQSSIIFNQVSFSYPTRPDDSALQNFSAEFQAGKTTFLVGESGSGKSTVAQLLLCFYAPSSGTISFGGNPIDSLDAQWIRENVLLVEQKSVLFRGSIKGNLVIGHSGGLVPDDIYKAADFALLDRSILDLSDGDETIVDVHGDSLSGGQKQRVALARAKLRDAPILILDEATSALDQTSRSNMLNNIRDWRRGKTTVIITHDWSQIEEEDCVLVLENGTVAQAGSGSSLRSYFQNKTQTAVTSDVLAKTSSPTTWMRPGADRPTTLISEESIPRQDTLATISEDESPPSSGSTTPISSTSLFSDSHEAPLIRLGDANHHSESDHASDTSLRAVLVTIWPSLGLSSRVLLFLGFLGATGHAVAIPIFSWVFAKLLSTFVDPVNGKHAALGYALWIIAFAVMEAVAMFIMFGFLGLCGHTWADVIRTRAVRHILLQPKTWFSESNNEPAVLLSLLDRCADDMRNILSRFCAFALVAVIMMAMAIVWSMVTCWKVTLLGVAVCPLFYVVARGFQSLSSDMEARSAKYSEACASVMHETFTKIKTVRALTLESVFTARHTEAVRDTFSLGCARALCCGAFFGVSEALFVFTQTLLFYYGAVLVASGEYTVEQILLVFSMLLFAFSNVSALVGYIPQIASCTDTAARLIELSRLPSRSHETAGLQRPETLNEVSIRKLSFNYLGKRDHPILHKVSFDVPPGKVTALVGPSGSGKSTTAALLLRLHPTPRVKPNEQPRISINGMDINAMSTEHLRTHIAIVPQAPVLFPASIAENIAYALPEDSPHSSPEAIEAAACAAGIHDFIASLPDGYATQIGDGASGLSGGQAQRIALARALVRCPQILVLDEVTSALDPDSAAAVRRAVRQLVDEHGLTVLVITHAHEMMQMADRVVMLEQGRVVETGAFEDLMLRGGRLAEMLSGRLGQGHGSS